MAGIGTAYQIGRSALAAYQAAIAITGQNIANVGNPDYARQSGRLASVYGSTESGGVDPGLGVGLARLQRHVDAAIESRLRLASGSRSDAEVRYQTLSQVESLYNELTEYDLSSQLSEFFTGLSNLQIDPLETTTRNLVLSQADAVASTLQRHRANLLTQISDLNDSAEILVQKVNSTASEIAKLNELIVGAEARAQGGGSALRDRRDALLRDLGELMDIQTREQDNGIVNVYIGSEPLVDFSRARKLTCEATAEDGVQLSEVRFADSGSLVRMTSGKLAGTIAVRDNNLVGQLNKVDQLAAALIYEVNRAQTGGRGLVGYTSITGTYDVDDANAVLNSAQANLNFPVSNGTFFVHVRDLSSGQTVTRMIEVDLDRLNGDDTSLASLAAALNAVPNLTASVTGDNRLQLDATSGYEISFSEDTSGALAALGVATFFDGTDARTIAVHSALQADSRLIATSLDGTPGDGGNAGRLAAAGDAASSILGNTSILDFHESLVSGLAVDAGAAAVDYEAADAVYSSLLAQRESISGVSLDEEAINLTKFERSFQGASRFLSVLDGLTAEVLALVS